MDIEYIKQVATDANNLVLATAKPYQEQIAALQAKYTTLKKSHDKLLSALNTARVWLGGKMKKSPKPTVWLNKYVMKHNMVVGIIEKALAEAEELKE